jgi:hypothetical protein
VRDRHGVALVWGFVAVALVCREPTSLVFGSYDPTYNTDVLASIMRSSNTLLLHLLRKAKKLILQNFQDISRSAFG